MTTVSEEVFTLAAPPVTWVSTLLTSGALKNRVVALSAAVGAWERTMLVPLTLTTVVWAGMPAP